MTSRVRGWSVGAGIALIAGCRSSNDTTPTFIGAAQCATCHATQHEAWKSSQHAVAMQAAESNAVLGKFDSTRFTESGLTSTFFRRAGKYFVNTEGPDGTLEDLEIRYTFGVAPLQQYVIELPGRMQALPIAWDSRSAADGGQRWFSLGVGPRPAPMDDAHWTSRQQNWNYMCSDCHSTSVRKGYDERANAFRTTWSEINVSCEACHGPGSSHAKWARSPRLLRGVAWGDDPLPGRYADRRGVTWSIDSATGNPRRSRPRSADREIETCAQCHARRTHIADGYTAGAPLNDFYAPLLLSPGMYHPDGQQREEVYTYSAFLQSKMYNAGVTCADCHDPHTQKLRAPGNQLCAQCHSAAKYDAPTHTFHRAESAGAKCVSCHMPDTTYMKIDPRRDHSLRIPRPDLSVTLGVPNACSRCHTDRDARWAADRVQAWYGHTPAGYQRFATAFAVGDYGLPGAADSLARVANDSMEPAIARASALARLARYPGPLALRSAETWSRDPSPLVRRGALHILEAFPPEQRVKIAAPLLGDELRSVRQDAAWVLAPASQQLPTPEDRAAFTAATAELVGSLEYNADRPASRLRLGTLYLQLGKPDAAADEYRAAIRLSPRYADAFANLAQVLRLQGKDGEAERTLREAAALVPDDAGLREAHAAALAACRAAKSCLP